MLFELQPPGALLLYPFRYVDSLTGRWTRARYHAEPHVIAERYAKWEITGGPELRRPVGAMFSPSSKLAPRAHLPVEEPPEREPPDKDPPEHEPPIRSRPKKILR